MPSPSLTLHDTHTTLLLDRTRDVAGGEDHAPVIRRRALLTTEGEHGEDPVPKGLAARAEPTSGVVRYGEDHAWALGEHPRGGAAIDGHDERRAPARRPTLRPL